MSRNERDVQRQQLWNQPRSMAPQSYALAHRSCKITGHPETRQGKRNRHRDTLNIHIAQREFKISLVVCWNYKIPHSQRLGSVFAHNIHC